MLQHLGSTKTILGYENYFCKSHKNLGNSNVLIYRALFARAKW